MKDNPLVLIIDDNLINLTVLKSLLEEENLRVILANSGEQGLVLAKQQSPDIILLDIIMPGWDGYETCQRIKHELTLENIPILFLSALKETKNKIRALQVGGVDYISKPFQQEELLARLRTHLELASLRQKLEQQVKTKTEEIQSLLEALQFSYEKVKQTSILKTEFLYHVNNEFIEPLEIILQRSQMLIENTSLSEEQCRFVSSIRREAKQLKQIFTNMLAFAQHFKGESQAVLYHFQIYKLVNDILKKFSTKLQAKDLEIIIEIAPPLYLPLYANQEGIDHILTNLIDNAIKFSHQGQIIIRINLLQHNNNNKDWVRFEISDTGIGITEGEQAHLFEIFSQIDGSSTRFYGGMGLGLAIAKMFTDWMGGKIGVDSVKGQGSTFWFNIPLNKPRNEQSKS